MIETNKTLQVPFMLFAACCHAPVPISARAAHSAMDRIPCLRAQIGCIASEPGCPDFNPLRTVDIEPFWIDRFEVSAVQFGECVSAGVCGGSLDSSEYPAIVPTIEEARIYCAWKGKRLPTSVEWEVAARGGDARPFPWGSSVPTCDRAAYSLCTPTPSSAHSIAYTMSKIGSHPAGAGPFGTNDLAGNAEEWTECGDTKDSCAAIQRSVPHAGVEALRAYAGFLVKPDTDLTFLGAGFRCARDASAADSDRPGRQ